MNLTSIAHLLFSPNSGTVDFDAVAHWKGSYNTWSAYGVSKLATLLHARELQRRLDWYANDSKEQHDA